MKTNSYLVKSAVALSLISSVALASDKDIEINDANSKDMVIKSSIQLSDNITEAQEKALAKIDVNEVNNILKTQFNGSVVEIKLENDNGNLVYQAEVLKNNQITDVVIDAGNGKILASKADTHDKEGEEDDEKDDENKPWYKFWK